MKKKIILVVLGLFLLGGCCASISNKEDNKNDVRQEQQDKKDTNGTNKTENKNQENTIPTEYKNALKKAETYSKYMHMSKKGIYKQLTSEYGEKFSKEASDYAINNLKADYNNNALEKAKTYYNDMHMSKQAVKEQLTSDYGEGFTESEANYAINNLK